MAATGRNPLTKPVRGSGKVARDERKAKTARVTNALKRAERLEQRRVEHGIRQAVYERDGARCRACDDALAFSGALTDIMHAHHVIYRSAGGADGPDNRIALCWECHRDEHAHLLRLDGDPQGVVTFTRVDRDGEVTRIWASPDE